MLSAFGGRCGSFQNLVLKGHALWVVFREPAFRGVGIPDDLEVIAVSDLLAGVDLDPDSHLTTILAMQ